MRASENGGMAENPACASSSAALGRPPRSPSQEGDAARASGRGSWGSGRDSAGDSRSGCTAASKPVFTEMLQGLLRSAISQGASPGGSPRVLLTTLPSEQHGLGMLMAEAVFTLEGAECVPLGPQTPARDVIAAALAKRVDIVALSFSGNFPVNQMADALAELRGALPEEVALWCGGTGAARAKRLPERVSRLERLHQIGPAIAEWRSARGAHDRHGG